MINEKVKLNNTDLYVSRLCVGGCPMGGYGWGNVNTDDLVLTIKEAVDLGINFFDMADAYGLGRSESLLGECLKKDRKNVVIQTKFGVKVGGGVTEYDNSPEYIEQALNNSLKRLKTDYVDIYTIHYRDNKTPIEKVVEKLLQFKKDGKIRYFGLSNIHTDEMTELLPYKGLFVDCQDEYSLACRKNENDLIKAQKELNVTPLTWGSLGQGILTGKYNKDNVNFGSDDRRSREIYVNFHGKKLEQNLNIVDKLKVIADKHGKSVSACAIRFILDYLKDSVVIAGVKNVNQLKGNVEALGWNLDQEDIKILCEVSR